MTSSWKDSVKYLYYRIKSFVLLCDYKRFDDSLYAGRRVIVIGPADTSLSYLPGCEVDDFDIIVRVNKSPLSLAGSEEFLGSRTDILYHCFNESPIGGGGQIDLSLLAKQKNRFIIYPYAEPAVEWCFFKVLSKYRNGVFYRLDPSYYRNLKRSYAAKMPTTGLQILNHIIQQDVLELHITGFTFFQTGYVDGYREEYKSAERANMLARSLGNHDPDDELRLFKNIYKDNNNKNIYLDSFLRNIVAN